jgi:energy-coupling factor transport system ATP-binding protein
LTEVTVSNLTYRYPHTKKPVLNRINLQVNKGEFVFITGKSGCGKSTLARTLNGTIPHILEGEMDGTVMVKGKNTLDHQVSEIAPDLGFIFQNPESQFFTLRVEDEVAFGPENLGLNQDEIHERVFRSLEYVNMADFRKRNVFQLSEGQKQRVAIAANLALNPDVLVLDEPTSNLDPQGAGELFQILEKLKNEGKTIILIDHRTRYARKLADRLIIMDDGKIIQEGGPELLDDPVIRENYGIRNPNLQLVNRSQFTNKHSNKDYNGRLTLSNTSGIFNHTKKDKQTTCNHENHNAVLEVENISFSYGNGFSINDMSFSIFQNEVVGIVGGNGSGKTTLANIMAGLLKPSHGIIKFCNVSSKLPTAKKIGMVLQNPDHQLFMSSVYTELSFGLPELGFTSSEIGKMVNDVIDSMNLKKLKERHPHSLSGGEKQRTLISALIARKPQVLILDEPTTGMDNYHMNQLVSEVKKLEKTGMAVILISHDEEFIKKSVNRIISISKGEIVEDKVIS